MPKIKELPADLIELALSRVSIAGNRERLLEQELSSTFIFSQTIEGNDYWQEVNKGNYKLEINYELY